MPSGKVRTVAHVLSPETGQAVTNFRSRFSLWPALALRTRHAEHCASRHQSGKYRAGWVADGGFQLRAIGRPHDHRDLPRCGDAERNKANRCASSSYSAGLPEDILTITL